VVATDRGSLPYDVLARRFTAGSESGPALLMVVIGATGDSVNAGEAPRLLSRLEARVVRRTDIILTMFGSGVLT
jgi:hypothetical protein